MVTEVRERRRRTCSSRNSDDESSGPGPPGVRSDMVALKRSGSPTNIPHDMRARACLDACSSFSSRTRGLAEAGWIFSTRIDR